MAVPMKLSQGLRYGENPHQAAAFYTDASLAEHDLGGVATSVSTAHHSTRLLLPFSLWRRRWQGLGTCSPCVSLPLQTTSCAHTCAQIRRRGCTVIHSHSLGTDRGSSPAWGDATWRLLLVDAY